MILRSTKRRLNRELRACAILPERLPVKRGYLSTVLDRNVFIGARSCVTVDEPFLNKPASKRRLGCFELIFEKAKLVGELGEK